MDSDHALLVAQFCAVTAASPELATFFLESANWQLDTAIHSFFEADVEGGGDVAAVPDDEGPVVDELEEEEEEEEGVSLPSVPPVVPPAWPPRSSQQAQGASAAGVGFGSKPKGKDRGSSKQKKGGGSSRGGVTTLSDLNSHPDSDSDSDGAQEYYTGGEKSGMMVQEPSRGQRDVDALFNRVRQSGSAREGPLEPSPAAPSNRGVFSGTARTLAGEPRQQEQAAGATPVTGTPQAPQPVLHVITFWRNGFTVGDGPLRRLDDPANAPFLDSINKAECPRELEPADRNTPVHVNLVRKEEDWQAPPEPKYVAFKGTGRTLGSTSESTALSQLAAPAVSSSEPPNLPFEGLVVDDTKPATSIQLRLSDGTRMVARFNHTHTVADIRGFIDAARPGNSGPYNLQTMGFPPRQLTDPQQTIQSAGLINAVIIQKN